MKRTIVFFIIALCVCSRMAGQATLRTYVGLPIDSIYPVYEDSISSSDTLQKKESCDSTNKNRSVLNLSLPTSYTINTSLDVGEIRHTVEVSPLGSLEVDVPIEVYTATDVFSPEVSIGYSSGLGDGLLGQGWYLRGFSSISQIPKSIYYDGETDGVHNSTFNSAFELDGTRLILLSQTSSSAEYQTEQGNIKVFAEYNGNDLMFTVKYPDGKTGTYTTTNGTNYHINTLEDILGNSINYYYTYINGHYRPLKIQYGKSDEHKITFSYSSRLSTYKNESYVNGKKETQGELLTKIRTYYKSDLFRTYSIGYNTVSNAYVIDKIRCQSTSGERNPLIMYYSEGNNPAQYQSESSQTVSYLNFYDNPGLLRFEKGKINFHSDGEGLVMFPNRLPYIEHYTEANFWSHSQHYFYSQYDDTEPIKIYKNVSSDLVSDVFTIQTGEGFCDAFCLDVDDIRGEDVVKVRDVVENNKDKVYFDVYSNYSLGGMFHKYTRSFEFNTVLIHNNRKSITPKFYHTGDFNGDGRMDILAVTPNNALGKGLPTYCYLFDLEGDSLLYQGSPFSYNVVFSTTGSINVDGDESYGESDKLFAIDYDGDGKSEICKIDDNGINIYSFRNVNDSLSCTLNSLYIYYNNSSLRHSQYLLGNFNNDSNTDIVVCPEKNMGNVWHFLFSKGNGSFEEKDVPIVSCTSSTFFYAQDIDQDGQTDILCVDTLSVSNYWTLKTFLIANGAVKSSINKYIPQNTAFTTTGIQNWNYFSSLVSINNTGLVTKYYFQKERDRERLLAALVNSYGAVRQFSYLRCNSSNWGGSVGTFPYMDYNGGMMFCNQMMLYHQNNLLSDIHYRYAGPIVHVQGRGFVGFTDLNCQDYVSRKYRLMDFNPVNYSVLERMEDDTRIVDNRYSVNVQSNKLLQIDLIRSVSYNKVTSDSVVTNITYDSYSNPTMIAKIFMSDGSETTTNTYSNVLTNSLYLLGVPLSSTKIVQRGNNSFTTSEHNVYNSYYQLTGQTQKSNGSDVVSNTYVYNNLHQLLSVTTRKYASNNTLSDSYTYNTDGLPASKTNQFGHTEQYSYGTHGNIVTKTDHKGHYTNFEYSNFDEQVSSTSEDGNTESVSRSWSILPGTVWSEQKQKTGCKPTIAYFDVLGREVRAGEMHFDGFVYVDRQYDDKGRIYRESYPFKTSPLYWKTFTYDSYDRVTSVSYADGSADTYQYDSLSVTSCKKGVTQTVSRNTMGDVLTVEDDSGRIEYAYDGRGEPLLITNNYNETEYTYDVYGRKTSVSDASSGTITYEYDSSGNLYRVTDAEGDTHTCIYDNYGRVVSSAFSDGLTTSYTYNTDAQITSITNSNGVYKLYSYDSYMRLSEEYVRLNRIGSGYTYLNKIFSYSDGKVSSISYSSDRTPFLTENYIYNNENLTEVKVDNSLSVWKIEDEDSFGNVTHLSSAGYVHLMHTYDTEGRVAAITSKFYDTPKQSFAYTYDTQTGCMTSRQDVLRNMTENFVYDSMNRLTDFGDEWVDYDDYGNITNSSISGDYYYGEESPYQLTWIDTQNMSLIPQRSLTYNAQKRVAEITSTPVMSQNVNNIIHSYFMYDEAGNRVRMLQRNPQDSLLVYYWDDKYENANGIDYFYVGGDAYTSNMVLVKPDTAYIWTVYFIFRDNQGSITQVMDAYGNVVQELSYDAWGNLRNPATHDVYAYNQQPALFLRRGYTGHEHLSGIGIINMNARLYDPVVRRFLNPDPYIQMPENTQNYNRYAYCLNNPLMYTDRSGEFWWLLPNLVKDIIHNIFRTFTHGIKAWTTKNSWKNTYKSWKITKGMFKGSFMQVLSRFTWELPQTLLGHEIAQYSNMIYMVQDVNYYDGATVVTATNISVFSGAFTLGSYVIGSSELKAEPKNYLFQHEYGHYMQSQAFGPFYLSKVAFPSLVNDIFSSNHNNNQIEQDANIRAYKYFREKIPGYNKWDFNKNYIKGYSPNISLRDFDESLHSTLDWKYMFNPIKFYW